VASRTFLNSRSQLSGRTGAPAGVVKTKSSFVQCALPFAAAFSSLWRSWCAPESVLDQRGDLEVPDGLWGLRGASGDELPPDALLSMAHMDYPLLEVDVRPGERTNLAPSQPALKLDNPRNF
jgi:hypothetical protein